jgi:hypothetical protein
VSRGTQDAASSPVSFRLHGYHILWPRFPAGSPNCRFGNSTYAVLQPPGINTGVWAVPISLAATFGISVIYFPPGTEMVHFPGLAHTRLCIQRAVTGVHPVGFLHSDIPGSKPACGSPRLFAACHVLLRLLAPRHPPYALSSLIIKLTQTAESSASNRFDSNPRRYLFPQLPISRDYIAATRAFDSAVFGFLSGLQLLALRNFSPHASHRSPLWLWFSSPCSTVLLNSSRTCNYPHHDVGLDRNRATIFGVDLPAFLLSKNS